MLVFLAGFFFVSNTGRLSIVLGAGIRADINHDNYFDLCVRDADILEVQHWRRCICICTRPVS